MQSSYLQDIVESLPLIVVALTGVVVLVWSALRRNGARVSAVLSAAGLCAAGVITVAQFGGGRPAFGGMFTHGGFGAFFTLLFVTSGFLTVLLAGRYLEQRKQHRSEFYVLLLFALCGMILMASATDLIVIFLGIELMSVCLYVLAGFMRTTERSTEAGLKYFLLGAFATGFLLYGIALVYGTTGTTNLAAIAREFSSHKDHTLFLLGAALLIVALSFKVSAVPFHMWAPDVYEGAPTVVTGFMSTAAKAAAFGTFLAVFLHCFEYCGTKVHEAIALIAAASMIVGNLSALAQSSVKRMLAYSSVAHAGYMLAGLAAGNVEGQTGILFYLAAYTAMNVGAFGVVALMEGTEGEGLTFEDYAGLSVRRPVVAALMSVFLFSLSGIPPLAGFFGKYYVFLAAVEADMTWLAIVGVLTSVVSVYYYLKLVVYMYFREGEADVRQEPGLAVLVALSLAAIMVLQLGIFPGSVADLARTLF